ncbi:MAG: glycosyltransferase family 4 protein [Anaerolineales bacterium]|nr:glycosyltransferase family 4 protein [Anaerolineales bacterium]
MRILVLNHEFPPIGGGGGRAAESICAELAKRGHEIIVLTSHLKNLPREEERDGYRIIRIPSLRTLPFRASFLSMTAYVLSGLLAGLRLVRLFRPDVIHVHFAVPAGALAWALSKVTGISYVLTAHLGDVPGGVPEKTGGWFRWVFPLTRSIWHSARARVAVSEFTRGLALKQYAEEILVIPNGIEVNSAKPSSIEINKPPTIVFAGRFMEQKSPLQVVQTLNELKDLAWKCIMIGDGPLMPDVKKSIAELGLEDRFALSGWVTPDEVMEQFGKSDILFMPSLSEGLPVVGVQALAKGLAIVASRVGGFVDLVDENRNGYLIEVDDKGGFKTKLQELITNPSRLLSLRQASLEKAKAFEISHIAEQYEKIFIRIAEGASHLAK